MSWCLNGLPFNGAAADLTERTRNISTTEDVRVRIERVTRDALEIPNSGEFKLPPIASV